MNNIFGNLLFHLPHILQLKLHQDFTIYTPPQILGSEGKKEKSENSRSGKSERLKKKFVLNINRYISFH